MEVWTKRIVFGAEINSFGLSERKVREVLNKVVGREFDWDVHDIRDGRNGRVEVFLEFNEKGRFYISGSTFDEIKKVAERLFKQIEQALEDYAYVKQYIAVYNSCNGGNGSAAKEIMRKVGIPVIS